MDIIDRTIIIFLTLGTIVIGLAYIHEIELEKDLLHSCRAAGNTEQECIGLIKEARGTK